MISVIISSAKPKLLAATVKNIEQTVGLEFEILAYENADGKKSICEIYNLGIQNAKYDILCFMHEDLLIKSINWGEHVLSVFKKHTKLGVLGVAGCAYKTYAPSGWDVEGNEANVKCINYIQGNQNADVDGVHIYYNPSNKHLETVAAVDGMWFCTTKSIAKSHLFDEKTLTGFHGYDLDFCLNIGQNHQIAVTFDILMEHFSSGNFGRDWFSAILKLHDKWEYLLPVIQKPLTIAQQNTFEKRAYKRNIVNMLRFEYPKKEIFNYLLKFKKKGKISTALFLKLNYYLLTK